MVDKKFITCDGNTAAANIAYAFSEVAVIYPITPSSPMGELAEAWSANNRKNLFGEKLKVIEMQSEAGAAGAIHGALSGGALTSTFTASQGLLLMLPNMFKMAGEILPAVFHVASRSLAAQALSIFGDHSDTMAVRDTGFSMLSSASVQEVQDLAVISHLSALESKIPFLHFFDGFRTSHEIQKIEEIDSSILKDMLDMKFVEEFRAGALSPDKPYAKVGAENPDVYFQGRETVNKYYNKIPGIVKKYMQIFKEKTGRDYDLFQYIGAPDATKIVIAMGSGNETIDEAIEYLTKQGEKVGAIKVRLYRPFSVIDFIDKIPSTVKQIAVLDRTKEPGSVGEPLYLDVVSSLAQQGRSDIKVIGGRFGLSSKEFTPSMVKDVFNHLDNDGWHSFTVGINDDVTNLSIPLTEDLDTESEGTIRCKFWGYGSDGTVSANKNSIKIIGESTDMNVQAYFEYDSKKSGGVTRSHLRFGNHKIRSQYLVDHADFIALHKEAYIGRYDILDGIIKHGTFLINSNISPDKVFESFTKDMQNIILEKEVKVYTIDATKIARELGLGNRINTIMQAAFFKLSGILDEEKAISLMKKYVEKQFLRKGKEIVELNWHAIDAARDAINEVPTFNECSCVPELELIKPEHGEFANNIIKPIMRLKGDSIPVSVMSNTGGVPVGTTKLEPRGVALNVPKWIDSNCIECGQCSFVCPHGAIRIKQFKDDDLKNAPGNFVVKDTMPKKEGLKFRVQVYPEFCVGCGVCVEACPTKNKSLEMYSLEEARAAGENETQKFFDELDCVNDIPLTSIKGTQLQPTYLEFSGACAGCGETAYMKLVTSLFGDRMIIANATGCSSIWGGTFPTIPYAANKNGKGPAWANSLFEDNAEYGYGMKLAVESNRQQLKTNVELLLKTGTTEPLKIELEKIISVWDSVPECQKLADNLKDLISKALSDVYGESIAPLKKIDELKDYFVDKSIWIVGGDGWAYDIGFGGLDHVLASGKDVNVLVMDTEVYSNTGGQASKATPRGATAKFAMAGKETPKKNLGAMMMSYGYIYVAHIDLGANKQHVLKVMHEAESFPGPSLIIAYSPCIAHGLNMTKNLDNAANAVRSNYWQLYRFDPRLHAEGKNPLQYDTPESTIPFKDYLMEQTRYKALTTQFPEVATRLFALAEEDAKSRSEMFKHMADK